jgi:polyisoprenyl-teichoic acid--peptidoglycan teichoic acid transferase
MPFERDAPSSSELASSRFSISHHRIEASGALENCEAFETMRLRRILPLVFLGLLVAFGFWIAPAWGVISRFAALPQAPKAPVTILLAGVGHAYKYYHQRAKPEEDFKRGLTDTMVVVQLNPAQNAIKLLSIPRDTRVGAGFTANDKINAAMLGGADSSVRAVEGLLGLKLSGYLMVSIDGTKELVDALGGIRVFVPQEMKYTDTAAKLNIDLKPGWQTLNGRQAEGYLRFRKDNLGDIGRVQRQQAFFRALVDKLREPTTITKIPALAKVFEKNTRTNLTRTEVGATLGFLLTRPRVDTLLLPGDFGNLYGVSYWVPDARGIRAMVDGNLRNAPAPQARNVRELSVAIVSSNRDLALQARDRLRAKGYRNVWISDSRPGSPDKTTILSPNNLAEAKFVRIELGAGQEMLSGESVLGAEVTVRVGKDFLK